MDKFLEFYHYSVLALDVGIFSYYHCALLAQVLTFLELPEVSTSIASSFLILGVLLSSHSTRGDEREARCIGFLCGYALMAYGLEMSPWVFLSGALLYWISLCKICKYCKKTNLTFKCYLAWHIGVLLAGGVYFGIIWKYLVYIALEFLRESTVPIVSLALVNVDYLVKYSVRCGMSR